jgi:hypothetical protein
VCAETGQTRRQLHCTHRSERQLSRPQTERGGVCFSKRTAICATAAGSKHPQHFSTAIRTAHTKGAQVSHHSMQGGMCGGSCYQTRSQYAPQYVGRHVQVSGVVSVELVHVAPFKHGEALQSTAAQRTHIAKGEGERSGTRKATHASRDAYRTPPSRKAGGTRAREPATRARNRGTVTRSTTQRDSQGDLPHAQARLSFGVELGQAASTRRACTGTRGELSSVQLCV